MIRVFYRWVGGVLEVRYKYFVGVME